MHRQNWFCTFFGILLLGKLFSVILFFNNGSATSLNVSSIYHHELVLFLSPDIDSLQLPALKVEHVPVNIAEKNLVLKMQWGNPVCYIKILNGIVFPEVGLMHSLSLGFISFRKLRI